MTDEDQVQGNDQDQDMEAIPAPEARMATALRAGSPRIIANWALRVANLPAFRAMPGLRLAQLQDAVPDLLEGILAAVAISDPDLDPEPLTRATEAATRLGSARAGEGFAIGVMLAELHHLRLEIWAAVLRGATEDSSLAPAVAEIQDRLIGTFDAVAIAAAEAWVGSQRHQG